MERIIIILLFAVLLVSCTMEESKDGDDDASPSPHVIVKMTSSEADSVVVKVLVTGADGNLVTGAIVNAINPAKSALLLNYDGNKGYYGGYFDSLVSGEYLFIVKTYAEGKSVVTETKVEHKIIANKPSISTIADALGNNGLSGTLIDPATIINISWNAVENATKYVITIQSGSSVVFSEITTDSYVLIPGNTLIKDESYSVIVNALYINGDPLFLTSDFSSESVYPGTILYFGTIK